MRKRKIAMLYGEKTVPMKSRRIPESKKDEIEGRIDLLLSGYHDLKMVEIDCKEKDQIKVKDVSIEKPKETAKEEVPNWKKNLVVRDVEKKSNPADIVFKVPVEEFGIAETEVVGVGKLLTTAKSTPNATKNAINMDALRAIANGEGVKSELFASKKKPIDQEYSCVMVSRGIPDVSERVYASAKSDVGFWDRDDSTVFYINWESKYYRFVNNLEFNRFLKDNHIK